MKNLPKLPRSEFNPELVSTLRSVLDTAARQIGKPNQTPAVKAKMAQRILLAASEGITDPAELTAVAIEEGMRPVD
jgi:hypothetical protein